MRNLKKEENTQYDQESLTLLIVKKLKESATSAKIQWTVPEGTKTRHFIIDGLLDSSICNEIYSAFPTNAQGFFSKHSFREKKRTSADLSEYNPLLAEITYALQDTRVVNLISKIVGFENIEPDPKLYAGGLSMMFRGDFLNPHIDNSHDGERKRYRRLNILYYVSPDWAYDSGGNFELWDDERIINKTIVSKFNRLVVMETNKKSWHSVSEVVSEKPRCCISNYYFSQVSPDLSNYFHVTSFTGRPDELLKRSIGTVDNLMRNLLSKIFKIGRGKDLVNKNKY